ncbi:MAG: hypothetical protein V1859_02270 [archaeon]
MKQTVEYEIKRVGRTTVVNKAKEGRFQVTVMKLNMAKVPTEDVRDFVPEIQFGKIRTCIQHSVFNKKKNDYDNQQIWIDSPAELLALRDAINKIIDGSSKEEQVLSDVEGDDDE